MNVAYFLLVDGMNAEQRQEVDDLLGGDLNVTERAQRIALVSRLPGGEVVEG